MVEGIWPKFCIKVGAKEEGSNAIGNGEMGAFDGSILVGGVGTGGTDVVAKSCKKFSNFGVVEKFTTLVQKNIFVCTLRGMILEETAEPMKGESFGDTGVTVETTSEVIRNDDPTGLSIYAKIVFLTCLVFRFYAGKGGINRKALVWSSGNTSGVRTGSFLCLLSLDTGGAIVKDWVGLVKLGNTFDMFMGIVEVVVGGMPKAVMP